MTGAQPSGAITPATKGEDGYVLISVLWIFAVLALAISSMSVFTVNSLAVVATGSDRIKADALASAGVERAALDILRAPLARAPRGQTDLRLDGGVVRVDWRGEAGRVDINLAAEDLIASALSGVLAEGSDAENFARMIVRRRGSSTGGAGAMLQTPFSHLGELLQMGMPATWVDRLGPHLTVYSGLPAIDPRLASPEILARLPGITSARLRGLLALREQGASQGQAWVDEAGAAARHLSLDRSPTTRLRVEAKLGNGFLSIYEVLIMTFPDDSQPYRVVSWENLSSTKAIAGFAGVDR